MMAWTYVYPRPMVTVDVVLFRIGSSGTPESVLLIQRARPPFEGLWALPGGFVDMDEDLPDAARRELREETGISAERVVQLGAYGRPDRDPRGRNIAVTFVARLPEGARAVAGDDAAALAWHDPASPPPLAFDHGTMLADALRRWPCLVRKLRG